MAALVVPEHLRPMVRQFSQDFALMSRVWLGFGVHDQDEIDYMREVIRESMCCEQPPDPEVDNRPREERIRAWCATLAALREEWERMNPPERNAVSLADMVIQTKAERSARAGR